MYSVHGTHVVPGMSPQAEAKAHRWELPSLVVALFIPPVLVLRELELLAPLPERLFYPITAFLIVEALRILTLCPDRKDWARRNLIDLVIIAAAVASLPFTGDSNDWVSVILLLRVLDLLPLVHRYVVRVTPAIFAVSLLIIVWLMGGLSFVQVETPEGGGTYTLLEGLYWSMTTITTVGYGDLSPSTPMGMVLTMILQPAGLFVGALIVAAAVGFFNREFAMGFLGRVEQGVDDLVDERGDDRRADDPR